MLKNSRNRNKHNGWVLSEFEDYDFLDSFDCGDSDLNDYFRQDACPHNYELLSKTYSFTDILNELPFPVALIDLCNDSVKREKINGLPFFQDLPATKRYPAYPAVKITRLGVHVAFQGNNIGSYLINMVKQLFLTENRTGCRLITVDAYNSHKVLQFYQKNDFCLFSSKDENRKSRGMYFDLKRPFVNVDHTA
ncbi:MAG: GNAT family N-acetyltransferase [Desulfamplus sp.]|nr:GNAT family N-acetyltransferase [Desulfamplus sp.]